MTIISEAVYYIIRIPIIHYKLKTTEFKSCYSWKSICKNIKVISFLRLHLCKNLLHRYNIYLQNILLLKLSLFHSVAEKIFRFFYLFERKRNLFEETNDARRMTCLTAIYSLVWMKTSCFTSVRDFCFRKVGETKTVQVLHIRTRKQT